MTYESLSRKLSRPAPPVAVLALGAAAVLGMHSFQIRVERAAREQRAELQKLEQARGQATESLKEFRALKDLKARDVAKMKAGMAGLAQSKRTLYEAGLALSEEKRLLEKQKEILSTYLRIDPVAKEISLMQGEHSLQDFALIHSTPQPLGQEARPLPSVMQIVSKERFAHPERGAFAESGGQLQWTPPQVGTSVRANALGEYVLFTNGPLILHGPPKRKAEHEAFPHACLGLSLPTARKLYSGTFIGTKIAFKKGN